MRNEKLPPHPPPPMVKLLAFSKATIKHQIACRKHNIIRLVEEVYNEEPHLFPIPPASDRYDDDEIEEIIWEFISRNTSNKNGVSNEKEHIPAKRAGTQGGNEATKGPVVKKHKFNQYDLEEFPD